VAEIPKVPRGHIRASCEIILFLRGETMSICDDDDGVSVKKEEQE
jgi:hypothetical protein